MHLAGTGLLSLPTRWRRLEIDSMTSTRIAGDVIFDRDIEIRMPDGVRLMANVFRPAGDRPCPVVMSVTPYGKDMLPDRVHMTSCG
jgi:predicted acyl esterase